MSNFTVNKTYDEELADGAIACFAFGGTSLIVSTIILLFVGDELLKEVASFVFGTSKESLKIASQ